MRLLRISDLCFHDVPSHGPFPRYIILSHTWITPNSEEVNFQDLQGADLSYQGKAGWRKIESMIQQVRKDNSHARSAERDAFEYIWIDTCCINKLDPTELTEAINCMFSWYRSSSVCYVYLSDVHLQRQQFTLATFEQALQNCQWIRRGWTLQEVVAPHNVQIFNSEWQYLCHGFGPCEEVEVLAKVTGIDVKLLATVGHAKKTVLRSYSIACRLSWAAGRTTTRPEDQAYSLVGMFDMIMPLH